MSGTTTDAGTFAFMEGLAITAWRRALESPYNPAQDHDGDRPRRIAQLSWQYAQCWVEERERLRAQMLGGATP